MSVDDFFHHLARSGLCPAIELADLRRRAIREGWVDAEPLAQWLLRHGKLSRYQQRKLLTGRGSGFILGPHEILAPLGKGGMGYVFLARDHEHQRLVALKLLTPRKLAAHPGLLARLERELRFSRRLAHPNVVKAYGLGQDQGVHWLALEHVPGLDLFRAVRRQGPLPANTAARIIGHTAIALDEIHRRGVVHTDLKPGNILVQYAPEEDSEHQEQPKAQFRSPKIIDFGLAIDLENPEENDGHIRRDRIAGTFGYAAPEQTKAGRLVGPPADLFALGSTLFYVLTGEIPFPGSSIKEKIRKVRNDDPAWYLLPAGTPSSLRHLLQELLAKKPSDRPRSAALVADALLNLR